MRKKDRSIVMLRSTGGQPSRFFLDCLKYINRYSKILNKLLARYFDKIELAHIETDNELAVKKVENTKLDLKKGIIVVDLESCLKNCNLNTQSMLPSQSLTARVTCK